jgi:required for meiotic nuclear division protein 1
MIVLGGEEDLLSKLAISNGLADSVKIACLENYIDGHIERVKDIPPILESGRRLPTSRAQVLKLTGQLLHFRAMLNLNSDLLDTPDMYWSAPHLEDLYCKISRLFENKHRIAVLNKKLDYASEMADVLGNHLSEQHTWKLEWGIIALITVEVVSDVLHWVLR